jgi:hypothetical protein
MHRRNILIVSGAVIALNAVAAAVLFLWPVTDSAVPVSEHAVELVTEEETDPDTVATTTDTVTVEAVSVQYKETPAPILEHTEESQALGEPLTLEPQTTYKLDVTEAGTVLDVMDRAVAGGTFSYQGRTYSGIGVFVEEVGGLKNAKGMYWILYINGETSDKGVSSARVVPGDVIMWNYEKSIF